MELPDPLDRPATGGCTDHYRVDISPELVAKLEALEPVRLGRDPYEPTAEEVEVLRRYVGKKRAQDIARVLGISRGTLLKWRKKYLDKASS